MNHYHNTLHEPDPSTHEAKAQTQDQIVLAHFRQNWHTSLSPSQVHRYALQSAPLTSVRRAISNLERDGYLVKDSKRKGPYGRDEYTWKLVTTQQELF